MIPNELVESYIGHNPGGNDHSAIRLFCHE